MEAPGSGSHPPTLDNATKATHPQPYTLEIRDGTLIYSSIVAHHRLWGHAKRSTTLVRLTGDAKSKAYNPFDTSAARLSVALSAGGGCGQDILLRNSVVGFYARGLHENTEAKAIRELLNGSPSVALKYFRSPRQGEIASKPLRWCKFCAAEDFASDGVTHWYVVHQLPFVTWCHRHFTPLAERCAQCNTRRDDGQLWMLPGDACQCIRSTAVSIETPVASCAVGDPYQQLLADIESVFLGRVPQIRPANWRRNMEALIAAYGSIDIANRELSTSMMRKWSKSREIGISGKIRTLVAEGGIERELRLLAKPHDLLLRLAIYRAGAEELLANTLNSLIQNPPNVEPNDILIEHLETQGVPAGAAAMLRAREPMRAIQRATRTRPSVLRRALSDLPKRVMDELAVRNEGKIRKMSLTPFNLPYKAVCNEQKKSVFRKKIRYLIEVQGLSKRQTIKVKLGVKLIAWMSQNDREWLEKNVPRERPEPRRQKL